MAVSKYEYNCIDGNISIITRTGYKNKTIMLSAQTKNKKKEDDIRLGGLSGHPDRYFEIIWNFDKKITKLNDGKQVKEGNLLKSKIKTIQVLKAIRESANKVAKKHGLQTAQY